MPPKNPGPLHSVFKKEGYSPWKQLTPPIFTVSESWTAAEGGVK